MAAPPQGERHRGARGAATIWVVLPPVAALSDLGPDRRGVPSPCHADGHRRRLTVTHGHSNHLGPAPTPLEEPDHTNRGDGSRLGSARAGHGRPIRFLVAEDRSGGGGHDRTGPERRRRRAPGARPHRGHGRVVDSGQPRSLAVYHRGWSIASPGCPCRPWERSTRFHTIRLTTRRCAAHCPPGRPLAGSNGRSGPGPVGELVASATWPAWQAVGWSAQTYQPGVVSRP
jgi:hypothetical protein